MQILGRDILISMIIVCIMLMMYTKRKNKRVISLYNTGIMLFSLSIIVIFSLTGISPMSGFHLDIRINEISFIPFKGIIEMSQNGITTYSFINIVGNIIMFMPVGFLLPLICTKVDSCKKVVIIGFCTSLLIESTQLFLTRGTDIDDLILNTSGAVLGYLVFLIFKKAFSGFTEKFIISSKSMQNRFVLLSATLVPYFVIIICGFYDRFKY
ncbi:MAG: VanZ family protein [Paeniclostridium sordellii]|nr:VanZ family protein [Paeniclostridium sordellii]